MHVSVWCVYVYVYMSVQFDNILMEEAAQILEIETFIPLLLQVSAQYPLTDLPHNYDTSKPQHTLHPVYHTVMAPPNHSQPQQTLHPVCIP